MTVVAPDAATLRGLFMLDPTVTFLNHGSYGACPRVVFEKYQEWQRQLEWQPVEFLGRRLLSLLAESRWHLAREINADPDDVVYVPNITTGVNIAARSLKLKPGDEILTTNHEYGACDRTWTFLCEQSGAVYRRVTMPAPLTTHAEFVDHLFSQCNERTRVVYLSHITSQTALNFPVAEICRRARERGLLSIVDGAHAPGQTEVDMQAIGADIYSANCHKWWCAPKGSAFLWVRRDVQPLIEPLVVSWGWRPRGDTGRTPFLEQQETQGTRDPAAFLAVPIALGFQRQHHWHLVRARCYQIARECRERMLALTGLPPLAPENGEWWAQMACVQIPIAADDGPALKSRLYDNHRVEAPVMAFNDKTTLRASFQGYNDRDDLDRLIAALKVELPRLPSYRGPLK